MGLRPKKWTDRLDFNQSPGRDMNYKLMAAAFAALTLVSEGAQARAYITGTFAGHPFSQTTSGWSYVDQEPVGVDLAPGASQTWTFNYTVTLHTDGLPATRDWEGTIGCPSIPYGSDCGHTPDGYETAQFDFDIFPPREASGYWNYTESGMISGSLTAPVGAGSVTYSGTFSITETATTFRDEPFGWADAVYPYGVAIVDAAPIPEAPTGAMIMAGLGFMALRRRR
jgi:hypothetical protein